MEDGYESEHLADNLSSEGAIGLAAASEAAFIPDQAVHLDFSKTIQR